MIIKKFVGKTEEEAVEAAKKELGDGIVIMNVKNVKRKGLFSAFHSKQVEVTVALEEERESLQQIKRAVKEAAIIAEGAAATAAAQSSKPLSQKIESGEANTIERKLDSLQTLLETRLQREQQTQNHGSAEDYLSAEKDDNADRQEKNGSEEADQENSEQDKFFRLLYNTMIENEVDEKYANLIMEETEKNRKPNIPFDYILASIYQKMVLKFGKSEGIVPAQKGPKAVFFIGPTGVGKTTTIAKVASRFAVDKKKKVALITADTYRIAAAEQLRTYANILEVPFRVVYTEDELIQAVADFREFDYIFVDTAGHSHQNEEQMEKLKSFLHVIGDSTEYQIFLVLSATTKYKDLLKIAENYKKAADYQLIFTKLDETATLGSLLNLKLYMDTPIAYVTCGQNVPDDIEHFNPQKTVKQLLGGKH